MILPAVMQVQTKKEKMAQNRKKVDVYAATG